MAFHRSYDLSCIIDPSERTCIQHAIDGVNLACSDTLDAWNYISEGSILNDIHRNIEDFERIPFTIFYNLEQHTQLDIPIEHIINTLVQIVRDYGRWRRLREEDISLREESDTFWTTWRNAILAPFLKSMSGGGTIVSMAPILEDFLQLKESRNDIYNKTLLHLHNEFSRYLGSTDESMIITMEKMLLVDEFPFIKKYCNTLKDRVKRIESRTTYLKKYVEETLQILDSAILSRNPVALRAALHIDTYIPELIQSEQYRKAQILLKEFTN
jgi:hypothetical protein